MNMDQVGTPAVASSQTPNQVDTRWHGRRLVLARVGWVVVLVLSLGVFIARIPFNFADLHILCTSACRNTARLTLAQVQELHHLGLSLDFWASFELVLSLIFEIGYIATGMLIFWRRSDERMALITSVALVTFGNAFGPAPVTPLPPLLHVLSLWMAFFGSICIALFFYTFPTGQFMPRWVGFLAAIWIALWGITNLALASFFQPAGLATILFFSLLASMVVVQVYRYRRVSTPTQHQQTKWVVFGLAVGLLGFLIVIIVEMNVPLGIIATMVMSALLFACLLLIPTSIAIAILRYRLWDIDLIINRTFVYSTLTASIVGIYVLVVGYLGALFRTGSNLLISLIAAGLVAVLFQPLRELLQRSVNRLLYGQRDEPYIVITRLSQRLEATFAPEAVLPAIVEMVAQALKLPYAAILLKHEDEFTLAASYGSQKGEPLALPLSYQRETIGKLLLAPRAPGEAFTPADLRLLNELARQVSLAAHAVRLTIDLQRSNEHLQIARARLVATREEERRRLRRDLHDGLGPTLATITVKAEAARDAIMTEPAQAMLLLEGLIGQAQTAISDIRRLVHNLRPPALDDLGLVAAIRAQAMHYEHTGLRISIEEPEPLTELPAAVEVAAYRIVQEALTNVVRHANARSCLIRLMFDGTLHLEVTDDGCGIPADRQAGVGLRSMQERAAEVGGSCVVEALPTRGTRVQASLPCSSDERHPMQELT
jgi:signal transduction histidine kinase